MQKQNLNERFKTVELEKTTNRSKPVFRLEVGLGFKSDEKLKIDILSSYLALVTMNTLGLAITVYYSDCDTTE